MKRIGVFLSSKSGLPDAYKQATAEVGTWIGQTGRTLVYGGARKGQMEELAETVKENGGHVIGVVPQILIERNLVSEQCDTVFYTADLHDRKSTMIREAEAFIALPGGIGTLDEIFTVLACRTIGLPSRPVILYNAEGCWDTLLATIEELCRDGLVSEPLKDLLKVATTVEELEQICG